MEDLDAIAPIAKAHNCSPARVSLAWLLAKPVVTSVIIGAQAPGSAHRQFSCGRPDAEHRGNQMLDDVSALPPISRLDASFQGANRLKDVPRPTVQTVATRKTVHEDSLRNPHARIAESPESATVLTIASNSPLELEAQADGRRQRGIPYWCDVLVVVRFSVWP